MSESGEAELKLSRLGFSGDVVDFYHRYRRGYPPAVIDALTRVFELTGDDTAVDIGCGTGQLTLPLASRVRAVLGVDPEPDMLARARLAADEQRLANAVWLLGTDTDVPGVTALLGHRSVGAVTIGQALHWMDHAALFRALAPLVRPGGGVAVVTNGTPLWLQDRDWSRALLEVLAEWTGERPGHACGTDDASQRRYREALAATGFEVADDSVDYAEELSVEQIVGGVFSAMSADTLPAPDRRSRFAERVAAALRPHAPFAEDVRVSILIGRMI